MSTEPINVKSIPPAAPHDWLLQYLQSLADTGNTMGLEVEITLQVSGFLVSGILVDTKVYFDAWVEHFSSALSATEAEKSTMKSSLAKGGEEIAPQSPQYIHLKDTRFFNTSGNPIPGDKGVWWRGRISEVGGFTLGNLTQAER